MKSFFRSIHLYLGLASGLIIMILCLTGAILVFEDEIQHTLHPQRYYVKPLEGGHMPLGYLSLKFYDEVKNGKIKGFKVYNEPGRTMEIPYAIEYADQPETAKPLNNKEEAKESGPRMVAFVNPYNGQVLELYNASESFFHQVEEVHRWLAVGKVGKLITGISTLIFLIILITGIILWWPKTRAKFEKRFIVKWGSGWKRLNHDFHIVLGFYSAIFLFIFAFTALAWSFKWFNDGIYTLTGSEMKPPKQVESIYRKGQTALTLDTALLILKPQLADAESYQVTLPKDAAGTYTVSILPQHAFEMQSITYWVDPYHGIILDQQAFADKNMGQRVRATFKPLHTASIFGWSSKLIGFIVCLLGVTFPVTGFILWRNRLAKKK